MRISDWSSDVCSSDLCHASADQPLNLPGEPLSHVALNYSKVHVHSRPRMKIVPSSGEPRSAPDEDGFSSKIRRLWPEPRVKRSVLSKQICLDRFEIDGLSILDQLVREVGRGLAVCDHRGHSTRSAEHPSELQSLKRIP